MAEVRTAGFEVLSDGEAGVERALDHILATGRARKGVCTTAYGGLHRFLTLNRDPVLDPLRRQVLGHTKTNVALGSAGKLMFRQTLIEGGRLSTFQAANVFGIASNSLISILRALNPDDASLENEPLSIDRRQYMLVKDALNSTMRSFKVAEHLGFDQRMMRVALDRKILKCIIPVCPGQIALVFRNDVNRLSRRFARPPFVDEVGLLSTLDLARFARVTVVDVMLEVVEGRLRPAGRLLNVRGLPGLLFKRSAADGLFARLRGGVHRQQLMYELGWMVSTVAELQRRGLIDASSGAVSRNEIEEFRRHFVTAKEACCLLREPPKSPKLVHRLMIEKCGPPAITGSGVTAFWSRTLIAPCIRGLMRPDADIYAIGVENENYLRN